MTKETQPKIGKVPNSKFYILLLALCLAMNNDRTRGHRDTISYEGNLQPWTY